MNLFQLLAFDASTLLGLGAGLLAAKLLPPFHPWVGAFAVAGAVLGFFTLTWPIMRVFKIRPILWICPACGKLFGNSQGADAKLDDRGVLVICASCSRQFVWLGSWAETASGLRSFKYDPGLIALLLDENGEEVGRKISRWPHFFVRWR